MKRASRARRTLTTGVVPSMRQRGGGAILIGTSSSVKEPIPNLALSNVLRSGVTSLAKTLWLAVEVETLAHQYHGCLQIGRPPLLPADEIERVRLKMSGYGHADV